MQAIRELVDVVDRHFSARLADAQALTSYGYAFEAWIRAEVVLALHRYACTGSYRERWNKKDANGLLFQTVIPEHDRISSPDPVVT